MSMALTLFYINNNICMTYTVTVHNNPCTYHLVTGTVVGNKYGLAKKATAIAVRVLNDNGSGSTS